ncbi:hypothetical protein AQUCO_02500252v1 [Aquilegia coerulea]|uniref:Bet v I/Major latex protein domain-containing protein n=1 Tax=Aquilegia coerulea TaxID=218851 RepID=A0A2G5DA70_AQUCA|nr:hypothetical protein AQUCO_02500252v1 [Aquilegia coerulea]
MGRLEVEVEAKSSADKLWEAIKDVTNLLTIFPDRYKSVDLLEGDGKSVGSIILLKYVEATPGLTFLKERIEEANDTNKSLSYSVIDGELLGLYKTFKVSLQVVPKGDGSLVKWSLEFEKASEQIPEPSFVKTFTVQTFEGLDAYIQKP